MRLDPGGGSIPGGQFPTTALPGNPTLKPVGSVTTPTGTSPQGAAAPYNSPPPSQPEVDIANQHAKDAYESAHNRINQLKGNTYQQYGYQVDGNGNVTVDPNNPFGRIQQLYRGEAMDSDAAEAAQRGRGFAGTSGSDLANMENVEYGHQLQGYNLGNSLTGAIQGYDYQDTQNSNAYQNALSNNQFLYATKDINAGNFNPANPGGPFVPPPSSSGVSSGGTNQPSTFFPVPHIAPSTIQSVIAQAAPTSPAQIQATIAKTLLHPAVITQVLKTLKHNASV